MRPEIFDDPSAMARSGVDLDLFDSMRALLEDDIDLDDRAAVERAICVPREYRRNPKTFARYVDLCIRSAKANKAAGGLKRIAHGETGFVLLSEDKTEDRRKAMILYNSALINAAADEMWKWEQAGRNDHALRDAAERHIIEFCEMQHLPAWVRGLLLDTIQVAVRVANGFPPDYGVVPDHE